MSSYLVFKLPDDANLSELRYANLALSALQKKDNASLLLSIKAPSSEYKSLSPVFSLKFLTYFL